MHTYSYFCHSQINGIKHNEHNTNCHKDNLELYGQNKTEW